MKTILVTGGAGFIGSHLCRRLVEQGHAVISLDNYFTGSKENHIEGVEYREGHTKDIAIHIPEKPDLIYHLGEYSRVEQSILEPEIVHDLNTIGTAGVIDFWRTHGSKLVYAGSSTKFGNQEWDKNAVPYVRTKAENTLRVKEIGDSEGLPYAITYFYNVYGPGERAGLYGTVIESFRQMYLSGEPAAITSPGTQTRNFTHIDDIVDGLVLVAEMGQGDEYGLGCDRSFSILEVARLFGGETVMFPERTGNRMASKLDVSKTTALGWSPKLELEEYVKDFVASHSRGRVHEKRVLVFSTTFHPTVGPAERALMELMQALPDLTFDIITTAYTKGARRSAPTHENVRVHRVGIGHSIDKFLLPFAGFLKARSLCREHRYLFVWSIMASYAAVAAVILKRFQRLPLLVTLADQRISSLPFYARFFLRSILSGADQVYGMNPAQEERFARTARTELPRSFLGQGDAFANQIRYTYAEILRAHLKH